MLCCVKTVDPTVKCTVFTKRVFSMSKYYLANVAATFVLAEKYVFEQKNPQALFNFSFAL